MPFVIKPIQPEDLDTIYPDSEAENIARFTSPKKNFQAIQQRMNWAVDEQKQAFLIQLPSGRDVETWRYLFGYKQGVVILKKIEYCVFEYLYISPYLKKNIEESESIMREAFQKSGTLIDEETSQIDIFSVPDAKFMYSNIKAGE